MSRAWTRAARSWSSMSTFRAVSAKDSPWVRSVRALCSEGVRLQADSATCMVRSDAHVLVVCGPPTKADNQSERYLRRTASQTNSGQSMRISTGLAKASTGNAEACPERQETAS